MITIEFPLLSRHRLLRRQGRGDGSLTGSRTLRQRCGVGGWQGRGKLCKICTGCRKTHNPDSPSDKHGRLPSNNFHQRDDYEPQVASLLSMALSVPRPLGTQEHHLCPDSRGHEPTNTSSCNSWALAGLGSRKNLQSLHPSQSQHQRSKRCFVHY